MLMIWYLSEGRVFIILIMGTCVHKRRGAPEGQRTALHPRELELIVSMTPPTWVLTTQLRFSERAASALYHGAISPRSVIFVSLPRLD